MRWQSMKKQVATFAAVAVIGSVGATSLGIGPAAAAVPEAQSTTAFCANVPAGFGDFTDISSSIHRRTIECLAYSDITSGKTATTYAPSEPVRRGQMASFIARAIDKANELENIALPSLPANPPNKFTDDNGNIHEANINRLAQAGIVSGTTATTFSPSEVVTRGQMATFINNAQRFLSGGSAPFTTTNDYFVDDETSVHEANINGIAAAGITAGVDATHYAPSAPVLRANMATFITRYLAVLHKSGAIDPLPPATNATLSIAPTTAARVTAVTEPSTTDDRVYTATNLAAGMYRVTLVESALVTKTSNTYTFTEDGSTNLANAGTVGGQIVAVNGSAVTAAQSVGGINPVNGSITFSVDAVDYGKLLPVIYTDQGGDNTRLNLDAQNRPTEPFGVGGELETLPLVAGTGALGADATVVFVDKTANLFVATIGSTQRTYSYDTNDTYYRNSIAPANSLTVAVFEAALSKGDRIDATSTYQAVPASSSVFVLENVSPPAPTATVVTPVPETQATITISDLITGATAKVYLGPDGSAFGAATPLKATATTDAEPTVAGFQVRLTNLTAGTSYEFYATQTVDGDESDPKTTVAGPETSLVTASTSPPTVVNITRTSDTVFQFNWSEAITPIAAQQGKYTITCVTLLVLPGTTYTGTEVAVVDADSLAVTFNAAVPVPDGLVTTCTAAVAAGAVQDGTATQNAAQGSIQIP